MIVNADFSDSPNLDFIEDLVRIIALEFNPSALRKSEDESLLVYTVESFIMVLDTVDKRFAFEFLAYDMGNGLFAVIDNKGLVSIDTGAKNFEINPLLSPDIYKSIVNNFISLHKKLKKE